MTALARAVHAFHTYPPGSPSRDDVIDVALEALRPCFAQGPDVLDLAVTTEGLKFGGERLHGDRGPERGLVLVLQKAYVSTLEFGRRTSNRDLARFCALVAEPDMFLRREEEFPEILTERGVSEIRAHVIPMHQTIEAGTLPDTLLDLVRERHARETPGSSTAAEGGWIRLDPSVPLERVTLGDLPLLLRDAPSLAVALQQLTGQTRDTVSPMGALVNHYEEIAELYGGLDPRISEALFRRLADIVRSLPDETRARLLKQSVLPGMVDGRRSGRILHHFSEEEIAGAMCLLLDMGVGGVEMLKAGLASLDLPDSRLHEVARSVSDRLESRHVEAGAWLDQLSTVAVEAETGGDAEAIGSVADRLTMSEADDSDFAALHSFDLSVDQEAGEMLDAVAAGVRSADPTHAALRVATEIARLSADATIVRGAVRRARGLFFSLDSRGDLEAVVACLADLAGTASVREPHDADIATILRDSVAAHLTPEFIHRVSALPVESAGPPALVTTICELGPAGIGALIESLSVESDRGARNRMLTALQAQAPRLAPELVGYLDHPEWFVVRNVLNLVGHAGPGWEDEAATGIDHPNARVVRESLLALARIGTDRAADLTAAALRHDSPDVRAAAADAIWAFQPERSHQRLLALLSDATFVRSNPTLARQLVTGAARRRVPGLDVVLRRLRWHALLLWDGPRRSLGWSAQRLLRSAG